MNRIALVEDHERLAQLIRGALSSVGIEADVFGGLESAWRALQETPYGALVVDRGLPDGDGLELVRRLRGAGRAMPCMMLTARDALHDRIDGLESGADDYLAKPFSMEELVARVRALLRRPATVRATRPCLGDLEVQPDAACMACHDERVSLAPAELQIVLSLVLAEGQTVRRSTLEAAAWGLSDAVTPNALDVAVYRLRRKLAAIGSSLGIVNVRGLGYALRDTSMDR